MKDRIIKDVLQRMLPYLNNYQMEQLQTVLNNTFGNCKITEVEESSIENETNTELIELFLASKRVEGCSEKTLNYYKSTILITVNAINKEIKQITTEDLRHYLTEYQQSKKSSRVTIDNIWS